MISPESASPDRKEGGVRAKRASGVVEGTGDVSWCFPAGDEMPEGSATWHGLQTSFRCSLHKLEQDQCTAGSLGPWCPPCSAPAPAVLRNPLGPALLPSLAVPFRVTRAGSRRCDKTHGRVPEGAQWWGQWGRAEDAGSGPNSAFSALPKASCLNSPFPLCLISLAVFLGMCCCLFCLAKALPVEENGGIKATAPLHLCLCSCARHWLRAPALLPVLARGRAGAAPGG